MKITGVFGQKWLVNQQDVDLLYNLINYKVNNGINSDSNIPQYIINTFDIFTNSTTQITLNLPIIYTHFMNMKDFLMNDVKGAVEWQEKLDGDINLFKPIIFVVFPNVNKISLITTGTVGTFSGSYIVYISSLLSLMDEAMRWNLLQQQDITIEIHAGHQYVTQAKDGVITDYLLHLSDSWLSKYHQISQYNFPLHVVEMERRGCYIQPKKDIVEIKFPIKYDINYERSIIEEHKELYNKMTLSLYELWSSIIQNIDNDVYSPIFRVIDKSMFKVESNTIIYIFSQKKYLYLYHIYIYIANRIGV